MEQFIEQVANIGFPIVLSSYLLVRLEAKMELLTSSIHQLSSVLQTQKGKDYDPRM